mgnify:CR=1 FL=1
MLTATRQSSTSEGFVDGKTFDGGKAADYPLTIGSHSFIDTFEEQLVGKNIGEECEINVTFPEEYHAAELAGKPATFKVTVKEIKVKELRNWMMSLQERFLNLTLWMNTRRISRQRS